MRKLSYAQEVAALEETLAAVRSRADVLPPLALTVADELEAQIAEIKRLKHQQRVYGMEGKMATEALNATISRGMVHARNIRACAVLLYGPKDARVVQFGIRIRRRPRRKVGDPAAAPADGLGQVVEASAASRNAAWTAHAARANDAAVGANVQEVGGTAAWMGGKAAALGGNAASDGAAVQPIGGFAACVGATASGDRENAPAIWEKGQEIGANPSANRVAAAQAA